MTECLPFFVYGTLRPGERNHDLLLRGRVTGEEPATLAGAVLYEGPGFPYALSAPPGSVITGDLVTPRPGTYDETLTLLDRLEGYYGPGDPRNLYDRIARDVCRPDGSTARAWVYLTAEKAARELRAHGRVIPGGEWPGGR
ncbi:gamma-glutamylcyclotransferase [Streptomyces sannanensis]|uniref:Gamma-glutamylcyclotransferase n=1 Tax=Streptomyces sannanensis TaxID=285536 RepID=A0ABP6S9F3_9ACTN